jgi:FkbH-like protein
VPDSSPKPERLVIAATFTAEPTEPSLRFWSEQFQFPFEVDFAPYGQIFQQLLDPASELRQGTGVVVIRLQDWGDIGNVRRTVAELVDAARGLEAPLLVCFAPSPDLAFGEIERETATALNSIRGVHASTSDELLDLYPVADLHLDEGAGHIPYTAAGFAALGTFIARRVHALWRRPYKVVVLDCDGTLWAGVVGELGAAGIRPNEELQRFILSQREAGMLLALCSKNREEDALAAFDGRMPLIREHLTAWRINWHRKSENLRALAAELSLGLDSVVFLDDNPVECAEVRATCPEVAVVHLSEALDVRHVWAFDRLWVTEEDRGRAQSYREERERRKLREQVGSFEAFLAGLELQVRIFSPEERHWDRLAQLTQRTNQFNTTTLRRTAPELARDVHEGWECVAVEVTDRFGDYGVVGLALYQTDVDALRVRSLMLSCRVLGRGVEHRFLNGLSEIARDRGLRRIELDFVPSDRNEPARTFLEAVAGEPPFRISAAVALKACYCPNEASPTTPAPRSPSTPPIRVAYEVIATRLRTVEQIVAAVAAFDRTARPSLSSAWIAPRTETERAVADVWGEVLGLDRVGAADDFLELGGTSLKAAQIANRLGTIYGRGDYLAALFGTRTVEGVARAVDERSPSELPDVETLSADEIDAMLARLLVEEKVG